MTITEAAVAITTIIALAFVLCFMLYSDIDNFRR